MQNTQVFSTSQILIIFTGMDESSVRMLYLKFEWNLLLLVVVINDTSYIFPVTKYAKYKSGIFDLLDLAHIHRSK